MVTSTKRKRCSSVDRSAVVDAKSPKQGTTEEAAATAAQGTAIAAASPATIDVDPQMLRCAICGERLRPPLYTCQTIDFVRKAGVLYRRSTNLEDLFRLLKSYWEVSAEGRGVDDQGEGGETRAS